MFESIKRWVERKRVEKFFSSESNWEFDSPKMLFGAKDDTQVEDSNLFGVNSTNFTADYVGFENHPGVHALVVSFQDIFGNIQIIRQRIEFHAYGVAIVACDHSHLVIAYTDKHGSTKYVTFVMQLNRWKREQDGELVINYPVTHPVAKHTVLIPEGYTIPGSTGIIHSVMISPIIRARRSDWDSNDKEVVLVDTIHSDDNVMFITSEMRKICVGTYVIWMREDRSVATQKIICNVVSCYAPTDNLVQQVSRRTIFVNSIE